MNKVLITPEAHNKIMALVHECPYEINGIARVTMVEGNFLVDEIEVLKQDVSGTHCEMDTDELATFLATRDDYNMWKCQWHSHVNMATFWSGTDEEAIRTIGQTGDWVLSLVFNKKGEVLARVDAFNVASTIPEALAGIFANQQQQLTEDKLPFEVAWPDLPDQTEWAKSIIDAKVNSPSKNWGESKKNQPVGDRGEGTPWDETDEAREKAMEEEWGEPRFEDFASTDDYWDAYDEWRENHPSRGPSYATPFRFPEPETLFPGVEVEGPKGERDGRRLLQLVKTPINQIWVVMGAYLKAPVSELKEDYSEEAIKDMYEEYLRGLPPEALKFL